MNESVAEGRPRLLVVEDDPGLQKQLKWSFDDYEVIAAGDRAEAIAQLRRHEPAVVLQDLGLPPDAEGVSEGLATLSEILRAAPHTKVVVVTGHNDRENALRAVAAGAADFYPKPLDMDLLKLIVSRAFHVHELERQVREMQGLRSPALEGVIATDEPMARVCRMVERVASAEVSVLLLGESGTGKELLARAIHNLSPRRKGPFVAINCAAIPEQLIEAELFGHEKGAFTGAVKQTIGKAELAEGGTLFLDEIGDMPVALQPKLLRFLQERSIERIGGRSLIPVDIRLVCATNQNLEQAIEQQRFRQDLFYRISEVKVPIPPLRDRKGAPTVLAHSFLRRFGAQHGRPRRGLTQDAIDALEGYAWPGNVRELENKVKTAVIMADGPLVTAEDLGLSAGADEPLRFNLRHVRAQADRQAVASALAICEGNMSRAAELLGISRPTLYDLMTKIGMSPSK